MLVNYFTLIAFNTFEVQENTVEFAYREDIIEEIFSSGNGKT